MKEYIEKLRHALDLAQCELRAMYKRVGFKGSNVLDAVDEALADVGKMVDHSVGVNEMIPERFYAVEYSGYWSIQTAPFYDVEDVLNADHIGSIEAEKNAKLIADLLNKHYAGQQAQGYNEQYKGWVALFKDEESYVQFLKWQRQQAPKPAFFCLCEEENGKKLRCETQCETCKEF